MRFLLVMPEILGAMMQETYLGGRKFTFRRFVERGPAQYFAENGTRERFDFVVVDGDLLKRSDVEQFFRALRRVAPNGTFLVYTTSKLLCSRIARTVAERRLMLLKRFDRTDHTFGPYLGSSLVEMLRTKSPTK